MQIVKTAKFGVLDVGGLKPAASSAPRRGAHVAPTDAALASLTAPAGVAVVTDAGDNAVLLKLDALGIPHQTYKHAAKAGTFLVTVAHDRAVNMKELPGLLGIAKNANLRLTDPAVLGVEKGSVSPYAALNDGGGVVTVALDASLAPGGGDGSNILTHPLRSDMTVSASPSDLVKYLAAVGHAPKISGDFATWYGEVITKSEMIEYGKISGCYILRPWSFGIWEQIQKAFDGWIKDEPLEVENCYFPLFVTKGALEAEEDHVDGFAPEVAWVTRSGDSELAEPIAIRPTSETIMYPEFAKWLRSHRDLPLKLNQWCSVVRWEFKYPTPFLRSREFLWQEGHTAHYELAEADAMVYAILGLYKKVYEDFLAVPAYIDGSGRAIQGATSHNLGQNFGKIYGIEVESADGSGGKRVPWQTSWGLTTRSIGVMVMVHSDDQGLVLPPRVAPVQVVVIPIISKACPLAELQGFVDSVKAELKAAGLRVRVDDRGNQSPGWKYNHWEQKGVPLRVEVGPRDAAAQSVMAVRRVDGGKKALPLAGLGAALAAELDDVHAAMFAKAKAARDAKLVRVTDWADFVPKLNENNLILTPWCDPADQDAEEAVKDKSRTEALEALGLDDEDARTATSLAAKTLCVPHDQPPLPAGTKCFFTGKPATCWCLWGRSY
ncbi:synthetase [Aureococcus anophagefferens]|nr:synthetase [Aureococcus anophagefferens]